MNALVMLAQQHAEIDHVLGAALRAASPTDLALLVRAADLFEAHAQVEEKLFYPLFDDRRSHAALHDYARDHQRVRETFCRLLDNPRVITTSAVGELRAEIRTHALDDEEARLFPLVVRALSAYDLHVLGLEMFALYTELIAHAPGRAIHAEARRPAL